MGNSMHQLAGKLVKDLLALSALETSIKKEAHSKRPGASVEEHAKSDRLILSATPRNLGLPRWIFH